MTTCDSRVRALLAMNRLADLQRLAGATLRPSAPEMAAHAGWSAAAAPLESGVLVVLPSRAQVTAGVISAHSLLARALSLC